MTQNKADGALERRRNGEKNGVASQLTSLITEMTPEFQKAMPQGAEAAQLVRDAITCVRLTPKLAECDSQSVLGALMTTAQLGLHVGVLGQAWPVPFWDRNAGRMKAQLIIGYQGYQELAHRSGKVASFIPRTVYENDEFDIDYGINGTLVHKPARKGPRGAAIGYHSIGRYTNGGYDFFYMSREEMEEWRDKFATTRRRDGTIFGPWVDHFDSMANKTTQRILSKSIPKSRELAIASYVDGGLRINLQPSVPAEEVTEQPDVFTGEVIDPADPHNTPSEARQHKHIFALAGDLDMDRDARLSYCSQIVDREIVTTSALSYTEAEKVIATMTSFKQKQGG